MNMVMEDVLIFFELILSSLCPLAKYFTDHSRTVLLLWIICVIYVCVCHAFASVI